MIKKKAIDIAQSKDVMNRLGEIPSPSLTLRQFIVMHFEAMEQSGKSLEGLYRFFSDNGIEVGGYQYFRSIYNQEKQKRATKSERGGEEVVNSDSKEN